MFQYQDPSVTLVYPLHNADTAEDIITTLTTLFNYSCCSSGSSVRAQLPFIESDREDSARYSRQCSREVERADLRAKMIT